MSGYRLFSKRLNCLRVFIFASILFITIGYSTYASSSVLANGNTGSSDDYSKYDNSGIYNEGTLGSSKGNVLSDALSGILSAATSQKPSWAEKALSGMVIGLTDGLLGFLSQQGLSLDSIIYGRVGAGSKVPITTFALMKGNMFGNIGSMLFTILRTGVIILMVIFLAFHGLASMILPSYSVKPKTYDLQGFDAFY